jgi:hypothetical protein
VEYPQEGKSLDISMYPMTLNAEKLRKETGFQFKHTAYEAFQRFSMPPGEWRRSKHFASVLY